MHYRKRNYQRGIVKRNNQRKLNDLIGNRAEVELRKLYDVFVSYEKLYKERTNAFENFIRGKLTYDFFAEIRRSNLEMKIAEREKDAALAAQKMRETNVSFERKSLLGRLFEYEEDGFLRDQYEFANSHVRELRAKLAEGCCVDQFWSFLDIERHFMEKFSSEIEKEVEPLSEIGVEPKISDSDASFGVGKEEAMAIADGKLDASCLDIQINYNQKYFLFAHDKITVNEYFENKFKKIKKRKEERNLRALAAEKTDKQRSLASGNRTKREYENQLSIVSCCPYCGGNLGTYSGLGAAHFEHIHPVSKGGLSTIENTVFICAGCNANKSNLTLNAFISKFTFDRDAVFERLSLLGKDF